MKKKKKIIRKKPRQAVRKLPVLWTTASGGVIRPADMGDGHLTNTVAMLRRRHAHDLNLLRLLRPCGQTPHFGESIASLITRYEAAPSLHPAYPALEREMQNRLGLEDEEFCPF